VAATAQVAVEERVATWLDSAMRKNGMTQAELSRRSGVPRPTISRILGLRCRGMRLVTFIVLVEVFDPGAVTFLKHNLTRAN
jgi:predicted XRE-type DNA-binding protein